MIILVNCSGNGSSALVFAQVSRLPLCVGLVSFKVAVDTRGKVDFSRNMKSPSILSCCVELEER